MQKSAAKIVLAIALFMGMAGTAIAQSEPAQSEPAQGEAKIDCSDVKIEYTDDPNLTPEEKLRLMDQAFYTSLSKYDACATARAKNAAASSAGGTANADGSLKGYADTDAADMPEGGSMTSTASTDMSGPDAQQELPPRTKPAPQTNAKGDWSNPDAVDDGTPGKKSPDRQTSSNGKVPDDIPAADNDSVLERQIRDAAINEPDPTVRAKLWAEYRKYKGLPPVE